MSLKLNIGAGNTNIEGFTPIDRNRGSEAYPLPYEDGSVDEILASHILEHFSFRDAMTALKEWVRVLKPGGRIRIAVPGFDQIVQMQHDEKWPFYLMGGQTDENDFHRSVWTFATLAKFMKHAGLANVQPWQSQNKDCAALPVSLNLEGVKPSTAGTVKVCAVMSIPRIGWNDAWGQVMEALGPFRIPVRRFTGVFWGQCMQRVFNECVEDGVDWILAIDYDSMFTAQHVDRLLGTLGSHPEIDALAALQSRRGQGYPLMTKAKAEKKVVPCHACGHDVEGLVCEMTTEPVRVTTAHFGLTLIRVDALKGVPKPWFYAQPDSKSEWEPDGDKLDDDIWFWHQWKEAGKTLYVDPMCRIGHLEVMVSDFDDGMNPRHIYVPQWRRENGLEREKTTDDSTTPAPVGETPAGGSDNGSGQCRGEFDPEKRVCPSWRNRDGDGHGDPASRNGHVAEPEAAGATA